MLVIGIGLVILILLYAVGPIPKDLHMDNKPKTLNYQLSDLDSIIDAHEIKIPYIKSGNQAEIIWADSAQGKTKYSLVYLHGFSASHEEGAPVHREIAKKYGMNLYLSRISGHGTADPEPFENLTVEDMVASAKEAVAYGKLLGEKVILMSCSTGGTFSLYLAPKDPKIAGLILYSPNIDLYNNASELLTAPWGLEIARLINDGNQRSFESDELIKKYWTTKYRLEGAVALKHLLEVTMTENLFQKITQPVFIGYYYKNEEEQDKVVSVKRILEMSEQLGTDEKQKMIVAFADVGAHGLNSKYRSQDLESVRNETINFLEKIMELTPIQ